MTPLKQGDKQKKVRQHKLKGCRCPEGVPERFCLGEPSPKDYLTDREKLKEKIEDIVRGASDFYLNFEVNQRSAIQVGLTIDEATDKLQALLTSEVEKEIERLLKEVEEKVIGKDEDSYIDHWGDYHNVTTDAQNTRNQLRAEQLKALSDIKEGEK